MTPSAFAASMRKVIAFLTSIDALHTYHTAHSLTPSADFKRAALTSPRYPYLYLLGLRNRDYNFLLTDFSFLQFSRVEDSPFVALRYAYYPNPYRTLTFEKFLESTERTEDTDAYEDYVQYLNGQPFENSAPVVRFDYAERDYRELEHPTAHMHFGLHQDNRWPVCVQLTPFAFVLHIVKMFYGDWWNTSPVTNQLKVFDRDYFAEKTACATLPTEKFSDRERKQLHFG